MKEQLIFVLSQRPRDGKALDKLHGHREER